jgi:hypothetical protein
MEIQLVRESWGENDKKGDRWVDLYVGADGSARLSRHDLRPFLKESSMDEKIGACCVATRPGEAGDKTKSNRILADAKYDRDRRRCSFGRDLQQRALPARHAAHALAA